MVTCLTGHLTVTPGLHASLLPLFYTINGGFGGAETHASSPQSNFSDFYAVFGKKLSNFWFPVWEILHPPLAINWSGSYWIRCWIALTLCPPSNSFCLQFFAGGTELSKITVLIIKYLFCFIQRNSILWSPARLIACAQNVLLDQSSAPTASRDKQEPETTTKHVAIFCLMISRWK